MNHELKGLSLIGPDFGAASKITFQAVNPANGEKLSPNFHSASSDEVDRACELAATAFQTFRRMPAAKRALFLRKIAEEIDSIADAITDRFVAESGLPAGRANGERGRTVGQLRMFAELIEEGRWSRVVIEHANPDRQPLPKPDTRLRHIGLGPVAVFGPANFPLAFSVAGGDTASALAAGCPVVVKAHSSHPGTCELVGRAIQRAAAETGMPDGVFSLLFGSGRVIGKQLAEHRAIKAIGFTGSETAGRQLFDLASARLEPIPVFAEMSSINPVIFLPNALAAAPVSLADGLYGSVTMGVGQFCTNPGLILLPPGEASEKFAAQLKDKLAAHPGQAMLNSGTRKSYGAGLSRVGSASGVETLLAGNNTVGNGGCDAAPALFRVSAAAFAANAALHEEVFGPTTLLVTCADEAAMRSVIDALGGQLTITIHGNAADVDDFIGLIDHLETKAGRIVFNGFPTGVEVCRSMVHGGPYPATTDARFTSVGTEAIYRFTRPVCYQGFPGRALPDELKD
jgi:alpha-ketoglutaric semialdehyde dehydrogenase